MSAADPRKRVARAKRVVVKVGSGVLTRDGEVRSRVFGDVSRQLAALCERGRAARPSQEDEVFRARARPE